MKTFGKSITAAAVAATVLIGVSACSPAQETAPAPSATQQSTENRTAPKAVETIKSFFASATTEKIATADPAAAGPELFDDALKLVDPEAEAEPLTAALTDLAVLKVGNPASELTVEVNEGEVVLDGDKASVPASHISVKAAGEKVANSDELAEKINDLVFRDGAWVITFPSASK
jgi:hypothetical protein